LTTWVPREPAERQPCGLAQLGVGPDTDHNENYIHGPYEGTLAPVGGVSGHRQPTRAALDLGHHRAGDDLHLVAGRLVLDQDGQLRVNGGQHLGQLLNHGDRDAAGA